MQSFPGAVHVADSTEALVKSFQRRLRAIRRFQPKDGKESEQIREFTEEHLLHFSNQIVIVQEIYMAVLKDGYIPRRPTRWVKKATDLKSKVGDALKEEQNSKDPSLKHKELKRMCDEMFDSMKHRPVEDVNDKPMAFIACMHETEDTNLDSNILQEDGGQAQHVEYDKASSVLKIRSKRTFISKGKSSQVRDVEILQSSSKDTTSSSVRAKRAYRRRRRHEEMPMTNSSESGAGITNSNSPKRLSNHHVEHVDESELDMTLLTLPIGRMREDVDLRLQILSTSPSQATLHLNNDFGLHPEMDDYFFSAKKNPVELEPEYLFVDRSGSRSKAMPTKEEWHKAAIVNLIDKNMPLQNEEPADCLILENKAAVVNLIDENMPLQNEEPAACPNLVILFLQRNSHLTHIPSTFFNQMPNLHFLDLSDTRIQALPSSLFKLTKLQVLLLRSCVCLDSLPAEVRNLIKMEVLDLLGTNLSDLPGEIGELTLLRHLQISLYRPDEFVSKKAGKESKIVSKEVDKQSKIVSSKVISKLQVLQGLSIVVHPKDQHWIQVVRDIIKQVGELKKLSYLQFYFPTVEALRSFSEVSVSWKEKILRRFKFLVGSNIKRILSRVPDEVESKYEQYDRCMKFVNGSVVPQVMKSILKHVTAFYLDHHLQIQSLSEFDVSSFKELKFCVLRECPNIQVMIIGEKRTESAFPNLEYLGLHYLWELERIWEDPVPSGSYQALKYLMIGTCGKLVYIGCQAILRCLSNLETFIIEDCESLKSIVKQNEMVKYEGPLLPRLKELVLRHLPQLVALGRGLFPPEEIIRIHFCPNLILREGHSRIEWKKLLGPVMCSSAQTSI